MFGFFKSHRRDHGSRRSHRGHGRCGRGQSFASVQAAFSLSTASALAQDVVQDMDHCPLCDNHCLLSAPSCPKGERLRDQRAATN